MITPDDTTGPTPLVGNPRRPKRTHAIILTPAAEFLAGASYTHAFYDVADVTGLLHAVDAALGRTHPR